MDRKKHLKTLARLETNKKKPLCSDSSIVFATTRAVNHKILRVFQKTGFFLVGLVVAGGAFFREMMPRLLFFVVLSCGRVIVADQSVTFIVYEDVIVRG